MAEPTPLQEHYVGGDVHRLRQALADARSEVDRHGATIEKQRAVITGLQEAIDRQDAEIARLRKPDPQLARENDELARGILELQRNLKRAQEAQKRAEGNLATAYNLAEMWRQRYEREKEASKEWRARYTTATSASAFEEDIFLPLAYFPAGEDPSARWGLTELGERALKAGAIKGPEWVLLVSPDPREVLSIEVRAGSRQETIYRTAGYVSADAATAGGNFLGLLEAFVASAKAHDEELGRALHHMETLYCMGVPMGTAVRALERMIPEMFATNRRQHAKPQATPLPDGSPGPDAYTWPEIGFEDAAACATGEPQCGAVGPWAEPCGLKAGHSGWHRVPQATGVRTWAAHRWATARGTAVTDLAQHPGFAPPPGRSWSEFRTALNRSDDRTCSRARFSTPSYDLAAICARCGSRREFHNEFSLTAEGLPCDGFLAAADFPAVPVEKMAGVPHESIVERLLADEEYEATPLGAADFEQETEDEARARAFREFRDLGRE